MPLSQYSLIIKRNFIVRRMNNPRWLRLGGMLWNIPASTKRFHLGVFMCCGNIFTLFLYFYPWIKVCKLLVFWLTGGFTILLHQLWAIFASLCNGAKCVGVCLSHNHVLLDYIICLFCRSWSNSALEVLWMPQCWVGPHLCSLSMFIPAFLSVIRICLPTHCCAFCLKLHCS